MSAPKSCEENSVKGITVVSTTTGTLCLWAMVESALMSATSICGFVSISRNMQQVLLSMLVSTSSGLVRSARRASTPKRERVFVRRSKVFPNMWCDVTMFFPCAESAMMVLLIAAMPLFIAVTSLAPVSAMTRFSKFVTVGFAVRE